MNAKQSEKYRGVVVPLISPFTRSGAIDEAGAKRLMDHLLKGGVGGIFALGTTGESVSIHPDEKRRLVDVMVQHVAGRAMTYAGIASNCFRESLEAAAAYKKFGVDAVVAHPPSYFPLSDADMEAYFLQLADGVDQPLILYNIPPTTHHTISLDVVDRLREHPNVVAIKDSANDAQRIAQLLKRTGGRGGFPVLLGASPQYAHGLRVGAVGIIPSGAHLVPDLYQAMYTSAVADQWDKVEQLQKETDAACASYQSGRSLGASLAMLKVLLEKRGLCGRTMLPPLRDSTETA